MVRTIAVVAEIFTSTENMLLPARRTDAGLKIYNSFSMHHFTVPKKRRTVLVNWGLKERWF